MEIRVPLSRERIRPAGTAGVVRPQANRQVDPGQQAGERGHDGGQGEGHDQRPGQNLGQDPGHDGDIGSHIDKTA